MQAFKRATLIAFAAACTAGLLLSPATSAENPYLKADETWISISGEVVSAGPESFTLDYGKGTIVVEMDDWDWYHKGRNVLESDKVTVYGEIDGELYDTRADFSLVNDLSKQKPEKLAELQALFMKEAEKNQVLPIDDRVLERVNAELVGRPDLMAGRTSLTLAEGMTGMTENVFLNIKNKSKTITAEIEVPQDGANGAILVQGGRFGGWALYVKDGVGIDLATPVVELIGSEARSRFTGRIPKVTIEVR